LSFRRRAAAAGTVLLALLCSYRKAAEPAVEAAVPKGFVDRTFHSQALGRDVTYRAFPASPLMMDRPAHVLYLLHGNGNTYRDWSKYSDVAKLAPTNFLLVMPEGRSSYFMNSASVAQDRYEDFITQDLIADAERDLPKRRERAVIGTSMGGFAAVVLAMKHPDLYEFAGALSPAIDYAERGLSLRHFGQSLAVRRIFGPVGSATRRASDPFALAASVDPKRVPYIFLSAGDEEPLLEPIRRFDALLTKRGIAHEFHVLPGGHNWTQWNEALPGMVTALEQRIPMTVAKTRTRVSPTHRMRQERDERGTQFVAG
jgi:putative tributyrin esterase